MPCLSRLLLVFKKRSHLGDIDTSGDYGIRVKCPLLRNTAILHFLQNFSHSVFRLFAVYSGITPRFSPVDITPEMHPQKWYCYITVLSKIPENSDNLAIIYIYNDHDPFIAFLISAWSLRHVWSRPLVKWVHHDRDAVFHKIQKSESRLTCKLTLSKSITISEFVKQHLSHRHITSAAAMQQSLPRLKFPKIIRLQPIRFTANPSLQSLILQEQPRSTLEREGLK